MCSDTSPRLSVLIPCYGAAPYIGRCLKSLVPLAGAGVEIVMADDCSPDDTFPAIISTLDGEASLLKPVTRVLRNQHNIGVADTRNRLLAEARGELLLFVDSDDYIDAYAVINGLETAERRRADITAAPYFTVKGSKISKINIPVSYDLNRLPIHVKSFSLCNKLIRRELLTANGLRFFNGINRWEDLGLMSRLYALSPHIV
ncbi:MAG: glycosyltransferase, partial [Duncaniella sp.]|nr:glycosyltransferase [Duncaniella sp.]